jgi:hypothetical protein
VHEHNRWYGAAEVLSATATRVDHAFPPPVPGHLQHDWDALAPCPALAVAASMPSFVWSDAVRRRSGDGNAVAVGAPWLYLLDRAPEAGLVVPTYRPAEEVAEERRRERMAELAGEVLDVAVVESRREGALWFPVHDLGGARLAGAVARDLRERHGAATVVLSEPDAHVPAIRAAYQREGHDVTSLGPRERDVGLTGPNVLERLRLLVDRSRCAGGNVPTTWLLHTAAAGVPTEVAGPTPATVPRPAHPRAVGAFLEALPDVDSALRFAHAEMGSDAVLAPDEIRALFEWQV